MEKNNSNKTVIYSTDLFTDGDFDDYFDLVALHSLNNINPLVVLDGKEQITTRSGSKMIENLASITDKNIEYVIGLNENLETMSDKGIGSEQYLQQNVDKIIEKIEQSPNKVTIVTVGSLRDISAAYNRSPELFKEKIDKLYVFAGDYNGAFVEHNVNLDEKAFLNIMNSGLSIFWIPCFENGLWSIGSNASYFTSSHRELFTDTDSDLFKWFLYRHQKETGSFKQFIARSHDSTVFLEETRNLWCAPLFSLLDGSYNEYLESYNKAYSKDIKTPLYFEPINATFLEGGKVDYSQGNKIMKFKIINHDEYVSLSKYILKEMILEVENM